MRGALVFTWGQAVRGREAKALEVFGTALGYWDSHAKAGRIDGYRVYFATTGSVSDVAGMLVVEGDGAQLHAIREEPEYRREMARAATIVENFTIREFAGGSADDVREPIDMFVGAIGELGYL